MSSLYTCIGFPGGSVVKNLPAKQEMWIQSLGWEDPFEKEMATRLLFLPGKMHRQRSLAGYSPWGHKRVRHDWSNLTHTHMGIHMHAVSCFLAPACPPLPNLLARVVPSSPIQSITSTSLFVVMLPKAHLTSHSRMSGSRWVIIPSWLSCCEDLFCTVLLYILATSS